MTKQRNYMINSPHLYSVFFAPRGNARMLELGMQIAQQYLNPEDKLIGVIGEAGAGKPAPDVYLMVAGELAVEPERCLVFEDVPMGILAGKNAGMRVCAVEDDFSRPQEEKKRKLADYYIQDYDDIEKETYEVLL